MTFDHIVDNIYVQTHSISMNKETFALSSVPAYSPHIGNLPQRYPGNPPPGAKPYDRPENTSKTATETSCDSKTRSVMGLCGRNQMIEQYLPLVKKLPALSSAIILTNWIMTT